MPDDATNASGRWPGASERLCAVYDAPAPASVAINPLLRLTAETPRSTPSGSVIS